MAKRKLTLADLDSLNMPSSSNTRGIADPAALQALAWGEDYDVDARRDAIAAAMLAQQVAQTAPTQTAAPSFEQLTTSLGDSRLSGSGDYGITGGASPGAGPGASQAGDSSSVAIGGLFGSSTPGYGEGAPGQGFGIGREAGATPASNAALADDPGFGGAMTTSNASMFSAPDTVVGGPFGGRGGPDREGFGENVADPALASPTFSEPDPAVSPASMFGRGGDTTAPASQAAQTAGRAAFAEAAAGRAPGAVSMTSNPTPGKGSFGESDEDALAEGATSTQGRGGFAGLPGGFSMPGAVVAPSFAPATPGWADLNDQDKAALATTSFASPVPSFVSDLFDVGKNMVGRGWDAVTAPTMTAPTGRAPVSTAPPGSRAPVSFAPTTTPTPTPTATPGIADPAGSSFGGFSEPSTGGYTSGFGSTEGFGAGYSGSASMGNTQGATGFTAGDPSGMGQAAAAAAASTAAGFAGTGDFGSSAGPGDSGASSGSGSSSSGSDPGGSSPGGVG